MKKEKIFLGRFFDEEGSLTCYYCKRFHDLPGNCMADKDCKYRSSTKQEYSSCVFGFIPIKWFYCNKRNQRVSMGMCLERDYKNDPDCNNCPQVEIIFDLEEVFFQQYERAKRREEKKKKLEAKTKKTKKTKKGKIK